MNWTDDADDVVRCPGYTGAVLSDEFVINYRSPPNPPQGYNPFSRKGFVPPSGEAQWNECGNSYGVSVDRCVRVDQDLIADRAREFTERANALALSRGKNPTRTTGDPQVAIVGDVRSISIDDRSFKQVLFVYDDGDDENPLHAVMRCDPRIPPEYIAGMLDDLKDVFRPILLIESESSVKLIPQVRPDS